MLKSFAAAAALLTAAGPAFAATYQVEAASNLSTTGYSYDLAFAPATFTEPGVSISLASSPVPTVQASGAIGCCGGVSAVGQFVYYFTVTGPQVTLVPLTAHVVIRATALASAISNASATANGSLAIWHNTGASDSIFTASASWDVLGVPDVASAAVDQVFSFQDYSNSAVSIHGYALLDLRAINYFPGPGSASGSIYLDPYIAIDPAWSAAHPGYSLLIDPNAGNSPGGVPEPTAWAMLLAGFGVVGAAARRRRVVAA